MKILDPNKLNNEFKNTEIPNDKIDILPGLYIAKDMDSDRWFVGYYFKHQKVIRCPITFSGEKEEDKKPIYEHFLICDGNADWNMEPNILLVNIDIRTLEKYTGKKPKAYIEQLKMKKNQA